MLNIRAFAAGFVCVLLAFPASVALAREWADRTGKFKVEAEFVSCDNGVVTLKKGDGKTIHLQLAKLSQADQDFVKSQAAPAAGDPAPGDPAAADNPFAESAAKPSVARSGGTKSAAKSAGAKPAGMATAALPLPKDVDAAAVKQATDSLNDLFKSELAAAKTNAQRADLASQFLKTGQETKDDPASQYVLLRRAAEMAAAAGQADTAFSAIDQLATSFSLNVTAFAAETLETLNRQPKADHAALAKRASAMIDASLAADDYDTASKLAAFMVTASRNAKDLSLLKNSNARVIDVATLRGEFNKIGPARKTLEATPLDPEANRIVGRYLCLTKRDWEHGLPMLSLGDDEELKKIAGQELRENKSGSEMVALGDAWDALARGNRQNSAIKERSDYWYRQALPTSSGVVKIRLERRLGLAANSAKTNTLGMKMVYIKAGEFDMGEDETHEELIKKFPKSAPEIVNTGMPVHHVRITKPFYMGACTVTIGQFRQFVKDQNYRTDGERVGDVEGWDERRKDFAKSNSYNWQNTGYPQTDDFPVVELTWGDAAAFCDWLSRKEKKQYRLPSSAEWEYACRAGTTTRFYFGDDPEMMVEYGNTMDAAGVAKLPRGRWAIKGNDGYAFAAPVGKFKPNPWGLYDMHGNVAQFCQDWNGEPLPGRFETVEDPVGPASGVNHLARGGGWFQSAVHSRSAGTFAVPPSMQLMTVGFRVVCNAE